MKGVRQMQRFLRFWVRISPFSAFQTLKLHYRLIWLIYNISLILRHESRAKRADMNTTDNITLLRGESMEKTTTAI
nr:MAG TPA: hypothetical protein [Caudoviricetes sp.]